MGPTGSHGRRKCGSAYKAHRAVPGVAPPTVAAGSSKKKKKKGGIPCLYQNLTKAVSGNADLVTVFARCLQVQDNVPRAVCL